MNPQFEWYRECKQKCMTPVSKHIGFETGFCFIRGKIPEEKPKQKTV